MKALLAALTAMLCLVPPSARAEAPLPSKELALDVIQWVRHGSDKFSSKYADQKLFAKKKNFVLYGKVFEKMAKDGDLPKGYSLVTDATLKDVDWTTTGLISVLDSLPDGGFEVHGSLGPLGMCAYGISPKGESYRVKSMGGS